MQGNLPELKKNLCFQTEKVLSVPSTTDKTSEADYHKILEHQGQRSDPKTNQGGGKKIKNQNTTSLLTAIIEARNQYSNAS